MLALSSGRKRDLSVLKGKFHFGGLNQHYVGVTVFWNKPYLAINIGSYIALKQNIQEVLILLWQPTSF